MSVFLTATVTALGPLAVQLDGDTVSVPAGNAVAGYTPTVGDRVQLQLRTPQAPLVVRKVG